MSERFVVISGCSGAGKSSLVAELHRRGHKVVAEPGRRVVQEEVESGGHALPWIDMAAFASRAITMSLDDRTGACLNSGWTFFDRGLVDAACALDHATGKTVLPALGLTHRYHPAVFFAEPWPEIYAADAERRHDFTSAKAEAERLAVAYRGLRYELIPLPKVDVGGRANFVLSLLASPVV